jgi:hypothetical protein
METSWQARWIWVPQAQNLVNYYCYARKLVDLESTIKRAILHISAFTSYLLYINGEYIGHGPLPGDPAHGIFYDTYDVTKFLKGGKNVIGVLCHNYGIGLHWQHAGPGGLIAQLELETSSGASVLGTDATWKMQPAECYLSNSPRMFWSAGFMETFDFHRFEKDWLEESFDDRSWATPEILQQPALQTKWRLLPRDIPPLREQFLPSCFIEKGKYSLSGVQVVSFANLLPTGSPGIVYAQSYIFSETGEDLGLLISCDDACKAFLNDGLILEQNYNEDFARTRVWRGLDEYDQVHYGATGAYGPLKANVHLKAGWNRLCLVVDQGPGGWGAALNFLKPGGDGQVQVFVSADQKTPNTWRIAGPLESSGMSDSLDAALSSQDDLTGFTPVIICSDHYEVVTDYALLMACERRSAFQPTIHPDQVSLKAGEYCIVDLGNVRTGHPQLQIKAASDAILDVGYSQVWFDDRFIRYSNNGMLKYVDRVYLPSGKEVWRPLHRRTGRYMHITCRQGKNVRISHLGIQTIGYPVVEIGQFECSDPLLNQIWQVSRYTTELVMQYGYQDCLKREEGTLNNNSFNYASRAAACCFGDSKLARRGLRLAVLNQHDDGWFDSHGISSPNNDEVTQCLYWAIWLKDYLLDSGDLDFVAEAFVNLESNLRFFSKMTNRHGLVDGRNMHVYRPGQFIYMDDTCMYGSGDFGQPADLLHSEFFNLNALFYAALSAAETIASALGNQERTTYYHRRAKRVRHACVERFWDETKGLFAEWRTPEGLARLYNPIIQIFALYCDLCGPAQRARLLDHLVNTLGLPDKEKIDYPLTTFGFYFYFLDVLFRFGHEDQAIALLRGYYGSWLESGATTFAESYHPARDNLLGRLDHEYEVHAYGTSAHLHFYTNLLGIQPLAPGYRQVLFVPKPGDLRWAKGTVSTPQGLICVKWEQEGTVFRLNIEMPKECSYKLQMPDKFENYKIQVNGEFVSWNGVRSK